VVIDWLIAEFKKDTGIDVSKDKMVLQRLRDAAEKAKIELSASPRTSINLPFLTADASGPKHLEAELSLAKFEQMIDPIIERTLTPCRKAMKDAGVTSSEIDQVLLVGGSTRIPMVIQKVTELFGREPNRSVNPDEVVAMGAAIQGGILGGDVTDMLLLDVTPLSLGIETLGGVFTVLIPRNTTIPSSKSEVFSTAADNQTAVDIQVFQGERQLATENRLLGNFRLDGLPNAARGIPQIEVSFDIDANGLVNVKAKDKATGREQTITITSSSGLSEEEVEKLVQDAEAHAESDAARRDEIDARNNLDNMVYQTEKVLTENEDKLDPDAVAPVKEALDSAKEALEGEDADAMKAALENLTSSSQKMAEALYTQAAGAEAGGAGDAGMGPEGSAPSGESDVIDAEFEEA
jgi:molecular chaperone DnaK